MLGWTSKKISMISVLIATATSFVIFSTLFVPITALPSLKIAFAGIPVKITGYFFGPIFGFITGFFTDIISFVFIPTYYHPFYSIALGLSGLIPGLIGILYRNILPSYFGKEAKIKKFGYKIIKLTSELWSQNISFTKKNHLKLKIEKLKLLLLKESIQKHSTFYANINLIVTIVLIITSFIIMLTYVNFFTDIKNLGLKIELFNILIIITFIAIVVVTIFFRFWNLTIYFGLAPIIVFSILLDYIHLPLVNSADAKTLLSGKFWEAVFGGLLLSPIKIWSNIIILFVAFRTISPLLDKTKQQSWL